jgi:CelD/BcsL family acetyltransferase involved in cellulose biosynthesis
MNFFASRDFLDATTEVYFKDRDTAVEDIRIDEDVLRLLVVDGKKAVTRLLLLDYHEPLQSSETNGSTRKWHFAQRVSRGVIAIDAWKPQERSIDELAPLIDWTRFREFGDYQEMLLQRCHGLTRDRERRGRALEARHGRLEFTMDDRTADVFSLAQEWKGQQLRETGFPNFFDDPRTMEFLERLRDRNVLISSTLRAAGRLVALWIGFAHERSWSGWIFAYDPTLRSFSPGHQLLTRMLKASHELGHREFDFSVGAQDYKLSYATHGRVLGNIGTPSLPRAAMLAAGEMLRKHNAGLYATALRAKWNLTAGRRGAQHFATATNPR